MIFNLRDLNNPRYQSELSLLSMTIDSIVGRPSNIDKFNRDQFAYDDIRQAFDLFVKELKCLDRVDLQSLAEVVEYLEDYRWEPAILAARSLRWAINNRTNIKGTL